MPSVEAKIGMVELLSVLGDLEKVANLAFEPDLKLDTADFSFHRQDVFDEAVEDVYKKFGYVIQDEHEIKKLCLQLVEKMHLYVKNLQKANCDLPDVYEQWVSVEKTRDEEDEKIAEERVKKAMAEMEKVDREVKQRNAISQCRCVLNSKLLDAKSDIKRFKKDWWKKKFRRFIADVLEEEPDIRGKVIAECANQSDCFDTYITQYMVYEEWNDVKYYMSKGTFGQNYPDSIVEADTFINALKANNVIKDEDLSKVLKESASIYDMMDEFGEFSVVDVMNAISDEDLAYENFMVDDNSTSEQSVGIDTETAELIDDVLTDYDDDLLK